MSEKKLVVNVLAKCCLGVWEKGHTFIFNFCIASHHILNRFKKKKEHTFIILASAGLEFRYSLAGSSWPNHTRLQSRCWPRVHSDLTLDWENFCSELTHAVSRVQLLKVIELRASFSCWMSARGYPALVETTCSTLSSQHKQPQHGSLLYKNQQVLYSDICNHVCPLKFATFNWIEASCRSHPWRWILHKDKTLESIDHGEKVETILSLLHLFRLDSNPYGDPHMPLIVIFNFLKTQEGCAIPQTPHAFPLHYDCTYMPTHQPKKTCPLFIPEFILHEVFLEC